MLKALMLAAAMVALSASARPRPAAGQPEDVHRRLLRAVRDTQHVGVADRAEPAHH